MVLEGSIYHPQCVDFLYLEDFQKSFCYLQLSIDYFNEENRLDFTIYIDSNVHLCLKIGIHWLFSLCVMMYNFQLLPSQAYEVTLTTRHNRFQCLKCIGLDPSLSMLFSYVLLDFCNVHPDINDLDLALLLAMTAFYPCSCILVTLLLNPFIHKVENLDSDDDLNHVLMTMAMPLYC